MKAGMAPYGCSAQTRIECAWPSSRMLNALRHHLSTRSEAVWHGPTSIRKLHVRIGMSQKRAHAPAASSLPRAIHKLDSANKVMNCAVFFFSPR